MKLEELIWKYLVGPIIADATNTGKATWKGVTAITGYNLYNTILYLILASIFLYGIYIYFKKYDIEFNTETVIHSIPFIILGGILRFIEDYGILPLKYRIILITPLIYFLITVLYLPSLKIAGTLQQKNNYSKNKNLAIIGGILTIPPILYIITLLISKPVNTTYIISTTAITLFLGLIFYLLVRNNIYNKKEYHLIALSQFFGGSTSMMAVINGYKQKQLIPQLTTQLVGPPGILILKAGFAVAAIYVIKDIEKEKTKAFITLGIITVGLATGLRVFLRTALGI